jgi:cytochrome P450
MDRYKRLQEFDPSRVQQTLFTKLFKAENNDTLSFEELIRNAQSYIIAGSDTTAVTLTYLIWSVCRDAHVKSILVKELQTLPHDFDEQSLRDLPYLDQVINETLRLYSAVSAGLPRVVPPGGAEIGGHWLNEGVTVACQAYSIHRNPEIFPNPEDFSPSRWESTTKAMKSAFMPFGKGPRSELQENTFVAMTTLLIFLA